MIRTIETLSMKIMEKWEGKAKEPDAIEAWRWMSLAHRLKENRTLDEDDVKRCITFLKENDGHPKLIVLLERCLKEGMKCRTKM